MILIRPGIISQKKLKRFYFSVNMKPYQTHPKYHFRQKLKNQGIYTAILPLVAFLASSLSAGPLAAIACIQLGIDWLSLTRTTLDMTNFKS